VGWDTSAPLLDSELGMIHVPGAPPSAGHLLIDVFDDAGIHRFENIQHDNLIPFSDAQIPRGYRTFAMNLISIN